MDQLLEEYNRLNAELHASQHRSLEIALRMLELGEKLRTSDN